MENKVSIKLSRFLRVSGYQLDTILQGFPPVRYGRKTWTRRFRRSSATQREWEVLLLDYVFVAVDDRIPNLSVMLCLFRYTAVGVVSGGNSWCGDDCPDVYAR